MNILPKKAHRLQDVEEINSSLNKIIDDFRQELMRFSSYNDSCVENLTPQIFMHIFTVLFVDILNCCGDIEKCEEILERGWKYAKLYKQK